MTKHTKTNFHLNVHGAFIVLANLTVTCMGVVKNIFIFGKDEYLKAVQCTLHKKRDWRVVISNNSNIGKIFTKNNVKLEEYGERYDEN